MARSSRSSFRMSMCRIFTRQNRLEQGKKTTNTDDRYFKKAEDNLHGELAMALGMEKSDMEEFITSRFYQEAES